MRRTFQLCALNERVNQLHYLFPVGSVQAPQLFQQAQPLSRLSIADSFADWHYTQQFISGDIKRLRDFGQGDGHGWRMVTFVVGNHSAGNVDYIGQLLLCQTGALAHIGQALTELKLACVSSFGHVVRGFHKFMAGAGIINYQHGLDLKCTINVHLMHRLIVQYMNTIAGEKLEGVA